MRKTLRYLGLSVLFMLVAGLFVACGGDNEPIQPLPPVAETFSITFSAENGDYGNVSCMDARGASVSSGAKFEKDTVLTLTATANTGYSFEGWYKGTDKVSHIAEYQFTVPAENVTFVAKFTINTYAFTYSTESTEKGTVACDIASGDGVSYNQSVTVTANANTGYTFDGWYEGTEKVSANAEYTFNMPVSAVTLQAKFTTNTYAFTYSTESAEKGTVACDIASGDSILYNQSVTVTANANTGYTFDGWYEGTEKVSANAEYTFNMPAKAFTIQAKFIAQKRTVYFYVDSDVVETKEVDYNTVVPLSEVIVEKTNHEFVDWFTDSGFNSVYGGEPVYNDLDLYAKFNPIAIFYTVRFFDYDGSQIGGTQNVEQGSKATMPANPSRNGYDFSGWTFDKTPLADNFTVESDMDIFATYTEKEYTVTFYDELGGSVIGTQQVKHGKTVSKPQTPIKSGYVFKDWLLNGYEFDFATSVTEALGIYADWTEAVKPTFTVTFYDELGGSVIDIQTIEEGGNATAPQIPVKTGKTFKEWSGDFTNVTANIEIYATYETATCEITFAYYDSTEQKDAVTKVVVNYGGDATALAPTNTAKAGYTFDGWDKAFDNVTEDMKVTAVYTIKTFTITFRLGDGEYDDGETDKTADYGNTFRIPKTPVVGGYSFMGWFKDAGFNEVFDFTVPVTANATVYGKLEEIVINTYTVKFVDFDNRTISEQTVVEHEAASAPGNPVRTGYSFTGWNKAFTDVTENLTVNAQYEINKYTVIYYQADGETLIDTKQVEYDSDARSLVTAPQLTGKYFLRWSKDLSAVTKDISVYAIYANNIVLVKFIDADGTTELSCQSVEYGGHASVPSTPVKQGYIFKAWVVAADSDELFDFNTVITAETEIFAKWEQASGVYSVYFKDYEGNSYGNVQRVVAGYYATEPSVPAITDPNREFDSWYVEGSENKFDFEHTQIFSTITLVARDKAKTTD